MVATIPKKITVKKVHAISNTSGGVCKKISAGRTIITPKIVTITVVIALKTTQAAALFFIPSSSFAPKRCPVQIDNPAVKPITNPIIKNIKQPLQPTAANALTPSKRPTIKVSLNKYNC